MISSNLSNRLIFIFSLLGLFVSSFLLYEYTITGPIVCPIGGGCDTVRSSVYSHILGIPVPILGIAFYLGMAVLSVVHSQKSVQKIIKKLQLLGAVAAVAFGVYLTFLEAFVIKAFCFWCVLSFIISVIILLAVVSARKEDYDNGN
ncbi:MAG: vitamin K epoxide reductase family protein [Patescibacteria group bacterium]|nr:vitamin K epoxide reductase family protein [Patescibacteria group bacterium]